MVLPEEVSVPVTTKGLVIVNQIMVFVQAVIYTSLKQIRMSSVFNTRAQFLGRVPLQYSYTSTIRSRNGWERVKGCDKYITQN